MNKIDFFNDPQLLNCPFYDSPFFNELLENMKLTTDLNNLARKFNEKGYIVVDLGLSDDFIDDLNQSIDMMIHNNNYKSNSTFFSYNESPRIVDAGSNCLQVAKLATNEMICKLLKILYGKDPIPFSTINFISGTEQPLHSDTIHFGSIPKGFLAASWVALEDADEENGGLRIVESSHNLKDIDYFDLNIKPAKNMKEVELIYRQYEEYVRAVIKSKNLSEKVVPLKKGSALIWSANLLHGGGRILDKNRTRRSQVTHYNFENCDFYFHPFFSVPLHGKYINRDLQKLDIRKLI